MNVAFLRRVQIFLLTYLLYCARSYRCSTNRKTVVLGFQNGSIRSYVLLDKKDFGQLGQYGTRWVHDLHYGDVSSVAFSYDDRYLFTTGLDGNFFVHLTPEFARFSFNGRPAGEAPDIPASIQARR